MTEKAEQSLNTGIERPDSRPQPNRSFTLALRELGTNTDLEAFIIPGFDPRDNRICGATARVSILYPLNCAEFRLPSSARYSIGFLAPRRPLEFLSGLDQKCRSMTLFGCGFCSTVLISSNSSEIEKVIEIAGEALYAWERWDMMGTRVDKCVDDAAKQMALKLKDIDLRFDTRHSDSTIWLLNELFLNFNRFYQNAQRYAPFVVEELEALADDVNELIAEIRVDEKVQKETYERLPEGGKSASQTSHQFLGAKKRLNANLDLLVQLNSALVYAVTQAFAGAIPVRQRFPHISQHSLLGTGTAWRAIHRVCSSIFGIFRDARFPEALREKLEHTTGANSSPEDTKALSDLRLNTRVVHFSARSGFGESDAAITCPSQAIQVCDQPEWSLCTATHEILHAHVRELIASVFCDAKAGDIPLIFDQSLAAAIAEYRGALGDHKRNAASARTPLQELRHGLIDFALTYRAVMSKAKMKFAIDQPDFDTDEVVVTLPNDTDGTFRAFKKSFRLLEETIVHVLDLHYFFGGDLALFSDSIWHSWSIVPSVIEKLDWYILRTLLALASNSTGERYSRLDEAAAVLSDSLNKILLRQKGSVIAAEVLRRLNTVEDDGTTRRSSPFLKWIDLVFPACLPLVDLTTRFFVDPGLKKEFTRSRGDTLDGEGHYPIDLPDFDARGIGSPIALIQDTLKIGLDQDGIRAISHEETARRSAWLLLALSSEPPTKL